MLIFTMLMSHLGKHGYLGKGKAFSAKLYYTILLAVPFSLLSGRVTAQILPDNTLPNNSIVAPNGNSLTINGGTTAGNNLFHSFQEFSIPTGSEAFFNNASNIQNIFSRVTGGKISNIDGLIRANGNANLFLLNPSGIIFGPNARLNIAGSFIGSTANSIVFNDGFNFSAANPQVTPLLTVNVPIGLQVEPNSGAIRVQGSGHGFTTEKPLFADPASAAINRGTTNLGLQVMPGNTLALIGGNIDLQGGIVTAEAGRVELGSISRGLVSISPDNRGWTFKYQGVESFQDIRLSDRAAVDVSSIDSGTIQIVGRQVSLRDGSLALNQNQGNQSAGSIIVNASESVELIGTNPDGKISTSLLTENLRGGQGGDITVSTRRLLVSDGATISSKAFGIGQGGQLIVNTSESIDINGFSPINSGAFSAIIAYALNSGNAGNLTISTGRLSLRDGGILSAPTLGSGSGANVNINATSLIEASGFIPETFLAGGIGAISTSTGNAGNVTINTRRLVVKNGSLISTSGLASGSAGSVTIDASESVEVSTVPGVPAPVSRIESGPSIQPAIVRQFLGIPDRPSGNSGDVTINTRRLTVSGEVLIGAKNEGTGNAGTLRVNARDIFLNNQGSLTASTASGIGGNIQLQVSGDTILRNGSQIAAEAAGTGNGGNLTANTNTLTILEGSKVTANAFQGNGGNIRITTQGLFTSPDSRITASSSFGVSGSISINNPNLEPSSGLVQLPENVVDPSTQIAQGCTADGGNTFTIAGRGGLPEEPTATLRGQTVWQDLQNYAVESPQSHNEPSTTPPLTTIPETPSLVEAVGWQTNAQGEVELVASLPAGAQVTASDRAPNNNCPRQKVEP
ncbi:MAG TPA: filamentous hemagglutinin N-terminal domain-containing protein [Kamptonema sp.]|nr:filamentous hemagglutinin N-terminal domain-containing protein [Kamptonema sp.]